MNRSSKENIEVKAPGIDRVSRYQALGVRGATLWMTGLSGSGKSTIAAGLECELTSRLVHAYRLDGDDLRLGLNSDLGFSEKDRFENMRRSGHVARILADCGMIVIASLISPYEAIRRGCRRIHEDSGIPFMEVYVSAPLEVCEQRDPKGLYAKARRGEISRFTGIDDPYEEPSNPDLILNSAEQSLMECVYACIELLERRALIDGTQKT